MRETQKFKFYFRQIETAWTRGLDNDSFLSSLMEPRSDNEVYLLTQLLIA